MNSSSSDATKYEAKVLGMLWLCVVFYSGTSTFNVNALAYNLVIISRYTVSENVLYPKANIVYMKTSAS